MISFRQKGDFSKLTRFLERAKSLTKWSDLDKYGKEGVAALASATPKDTGKTAASWDYRITYPRNDAVLSFYNSNVNDGVNIAWILQYGHATRNGGWVEGIDYIPPVINPLFDKIVDYATEEMRHL